MKGFNEKARQRASGARWQDDYQGVPGGGPQNGRQAACVYLGQVWHGVLVQWADALREVDVRPLIEPDELAGALVLTLDQVLPAEVELTPEMFAAVGSSALLAQRFFHREKIAAARERKANAERFRTARPIPKDDRPSAPVGVDARPPEPPPPMVALTVVPGPVSVEATPDENLPPSARKKTYGHRLSDLG